MPERKQVIPVLGKDASTIMALAFGAFESLNWDVKCASENVLLAHTSLGLSKYGEEITIETADNNLTITCKMIHGESFDLFGKNKKHITHFENNFLLINQSATHQQITQWQEKITVLKEQTIKKAEEEIKEAAQLDQVMHFSTGSNHLTIGLVVLNVLAYICMAIGGVNIFSPTPEDLLKWGGNMTSATIDGGWWRLITNCFIHGSILHLLVNMYSLFFIGLFLEPMLGKIKFLSAYLCTGVLASLASLWWHKNQLIVSVGASGAIFGMFGVFLALLTTKVIPVSIRKSMLQTILIFVGYNLLAGLRESVDNSAHIGGLLSGLVFGYFFYYLIRDNAIRIKNEVVAVVLVIFTVLVSTYTLKKVKPNFFNTVQKEELTEFFDKLMRAAKLDSMNDNGSGTISYYINEKIENEYPTEKPESMLQFQKKLKDFLPGEQQALEFYQQAGTGTLEDYLKELKKKMGFWQQAANIFEEGSRDLPTQFKTICNDFIEYCRLYQEKTRLLFHIFSRGEGNYDDGLQRTNSDITDIRSKMLITLIE